MSQLKQKWRDEGASGTQTGAERARHRRLRRKDGLRIAEVEIDEFRVTDRLIDLGKICESDSADFHKVQAALAKLIAEI